MWTGKDMDARALVDELLKFVRTSPLGEFRLRLKLSMQWVGWSLCVCKVWKDHNYPQSQAFKTHQNITLQHTKGLQMLHAAARLHLEATSRQDDARVSTGRDSLWKFLRFFLIHLIHTSNMPVGLHSFSPLPSGSPAGKLLVHRNTSLCSLLAGTCRHILWMWGDAIGAISVCKRCC